MAIENKGSAGTLTADGDTDEVVGRGECMFVFDGSFGSGTITLYQWLVDKYVPITDDSTDLTFTVDGSQIVDYPDGVVSKVKATLAGSTSPDIDWRIIFDRGSQ